MQEKCNLILQCNLMQFNLICMGSYYVTYLYKKSPPYVARKSVGLGYSNCSLHGRGTSMFVLNKALRNDFKLFQVVYPFWFPKPKTMKCEMLFYILYPVVIWVPIYKDQQRRARKKKNLMTETSSLVERNYK